jgi:hypothetical protein
MRASRVAAIGLVAGFAAGIVLSDLIGVVGVLVFDRHAGIRFLPIYLAVAFAILAPVLDVLDRRARSRSGR